jgi:hypothetical protein
LPFCSTSFSRGRTSWCESEASRALGQYDGITSTWRKCRQMPCRASTAWQIAVPCRQAKAKYCGMPAPAAAIAVPCRQRLKPTTRILAQKHCPPSVTVQAQSLPAVRVVTHKTEASVRVSPQSVGMEDLDAAVSPWVPLNSVVLDRATPAPSAAHSGFGTY